MNEWLKGQKILSRKQLMKMAEEWLKTPLETPMKTTKRGTAEQCNLAAILSSIRKARERRGFPQKSTLVDLVEQWQEVRPNECLYLRKKNELMLMAECTWEGYLDSMGAVNKLKKTDADPQFVMEEEDNAIRLLGLTPGEDMEPEEEQETEEETDY